MNDLRSRTKIKSHIDLIDIVKNHSTITAVAFSHRYRVNSTTVMISVISSGKLRFQIDILE